MPVPAGTVNVPGTIVGPATTVEGALAEAPAAVGATVLAVVGAVVTFVVLAADFVVEDVVVFVVVFWVVTVVVGTVVTVLLVAIVIAAGAGSSDPGDSEEAPDAGSTMIPVRATMRRPARRKDAARGFERCIHQVGRIGS